MIRLWLGTVPLAEATEEQKEALAEAVMESVVSNED